MVEEDGEFADRATGGRGDRADAGGLGEALGLWREGFFLFERGRDGGLEFFDLRTKTLTRARARLRLSLRVWPALYWSTTVRCSTNC
jgi:hypothetical protein